MMFIHLHWSGIFFWNEANDRFDCGIWEHHCKHLQPIGGPPESVLMRAHPIMYADLIPVNVIANYNIIDEL